MGLDDYYLKLGKQRTPETARSLSTWKTLRILGGVFNRKLWNFISSKMVYLTCFASNFLFSMAVAIFFNVNQILFFIFYLKNRIFVRSTYSCCFCWAIAIVVWTQSFAFFNLLIIPFIFLIKLPIPACSFSSVSKILGWYPWGKKKKKKKKKRVDTRRNCVFIVDNEFGYK